MQTHFSPSPQAGPNQNQETVIFLLQAVNRPGIDSLIDYLLESDYFTAPASTRFHNSFPGGLCLHSLNLFHAFNDANKQLMKPLPPDSVVICGLLHDLCKVNVYLPTGKGYKSVKGTTGHATLSLSRIEEHIRLTPQEDDVIRYHMGLFGIFTYREHDTLSMHRAILRTPQVQIFAALDMADSKRSTAKGGLKMETTDTTNMRTITVCPACRGRSIYIKM
jgi:23S rRNA maturation-related 3'-5' exoribonuclease YhaM